MPSNKDSKRVSHRRLTIPIHGLSCGGGGTLSLEKCLRRLPELQGVYVNPATEEAYLDVNDEFQVEAALQTIRDLGFTYGSYHFDP